MNKTMNYKVWDTKTKQMFEVAGIDYVQGEIYPVHEDEFKRFIPLSEGILLPQTPFVDSKGQPLFAGAIIKVADTVYFSDGGFCENQDEAYGETQIENYFALEFNGFEFLLTKSKYGLLEESALWSSIYEDNMRVLSDFLQLSDDFTIVGNLYENADLIKNKEQK
jgi:hypothetical protein